MMNAFKCDNFRYVWYNFMHLQDVNLEDDFCCKECGLNPQTVIMDGRSIFDKTWIVEGHFFSINKHHHPQNLADKCHVIS